MDTNNAERTAKAVMCAQLTYHEDMIWSGNCGDILLREMSGRGERGVCTVDGRPDHQSLAVRCRCL